MKIGKLLFLGLIFCFAVQVSKSQKIESPIMPEENVVYDWELGGFIGIGINFNSGTYTAECPECLFDDASKFGFSIGVKMDYEILRWFYIGANLIYDNESVDGAFRRIESIPLTRGDGSIMDVPIEFRHVMNLKLNSFTLAPNAIFRIDDWLDIRLGFYTDFLFGSNITHTKELLTKTAVLPDGEKVNVTIPNTKNNIAELENHAIPGLSSTVFGLFPQININIPISDGSDFIIGSYLKMPFSAISSQQSNFKIDVWRFFLGLSFDLNDANAYRAKVDAIKNKK
jgi:hypothetical protein